MPLVKHIAAAARSSMSRYAKALSSADASELLVVDRAVRRVAGADRDDVLEAHAVDELRGERPEHLVDDEHAVARVRRDVRVVVGVQAEVQGVRDEAAHRRADVRLEVLVVVPHERRDAVAVLEAETAQRDREPLRARREVGVRVPVPALVREPRDDLALGVELVAAAEDRRDVQLVVHHQALHRAPPPSDVSRVLSHRAGGSRPRRGAAPTRPPRTGSRARACRAGAARAPT